MSYCLHSMVIFVISVLLLRRASLCEATTNCNEDQYCSCNGTVYYGKKFVNGKPGSGTITTLKEMLNTDKSFLTKELSGPYLCSVESFRKDPLPAEILPPPMCGPAKSISGHRVAVGFYGHTRYLRITLPTFQKHIFNVLKTHHIDFDVFSSTEVGYFKSRKKYMEQDEYEIRMMRPCAAIVFPEILNLTTGEDHNSLTALKGLHSLISAYAHQHSLKYDALLFMRLDRAAIKDLDLPSLLLKEKFSSSHVYIPRTAYTDDHITFASPDVLLTYLNFHISNPDSLTPQVTLPRKKSHMEIVGIKNNRPIAGYRVEPKLPQLERRKCGVSSSTKSVARVAVGFYGLSRNLRLTLPTIKRHVFDVLTKNNIVYDVFWSTVTVPVLISNRSNESRIDIDEYDARLMRPCVASLQPMHKILNETSFDYTNISPYYHYRDGYSSVRNIFCSLETQKILDHMIKSYSSRYGIKYTSVLTLRPDTAVVRDIDLAGLIKSKRFSSKHIYLPNFAHFKGVNDRAAFGSPEIMSIYLNRKNAFMTSLSTNTNRWIYNTETFLKNYLKEKHVPVIKSTLRVMRVRADGKIPFYDSDVNMMFMSRKEIERCQMSIKNSSTGQVVTVLDTTMC